MHSTHKNVTAESIRRIDANVAAKLVKTTQYRQKLSLVTRSTPNGTASGDKVIGNRREFFLACAH
jgi:hypothetical protein